MPTRARAGSPPPPPPRWSSRSRPASAPRRTMLTGAARIGAAVARRRPGHARPDGSTGLPVNSKVSATASAPHGARATARKLCLGPWCAVAPERSPDRQGHRRARQLVNVVVRQWPAWRLRAEKCLAERALERAAAHLDSRRGRLPVRVPDPRRRPRAHLRAPAPASVAGRSRERRPGNRAVRGRRRDARDSGQRPERPHLRDRAPVHRRRRHRTMDREASRAARGRTQGHPARHHRGLLRP